MQKNYETVFILTPILSEKQIEDAVKKFTDSIKKNKGTLINEELWGIKKLAYPIQHKKTGFYVLLEFQADTSFIDILETEFRRDEKVMRFLTTVLDKFALAYNDKRRSGAFAKNKVEKNKKD